MLVAMGRSRGELSPTSPAGSGSWAMMGRCTTRRILAGLAALVFGRQCVGVKLFGELRSLGIPGGQRVLHRADRQAGRVALAGEHADETPEDRLRRSGGGP